LKNQQREELTASAQVIHSALKLIQLVKKFINFTKDGIKIISIQTNL